MLACVLLTIISLFLLYFILDVLSEYNTGFKKINKIKKHTQINDPIIKFFLLLMLTTVHTLITVLLVT